MASGMQIGEAYVRIRPDTDSFGRETEQQVEGSLSRVGRFAAGAVASVGFASIVKSAAEAEQAVGGTAAVFGDFASIIDEFAQGADVAAGLSEQAARRLTSQIGGLLKGFEFTAEEAANTSVQLAQLGADLAATFGGNPEEAVQALGAALRGEFDPLERFGVSLNITQANLKAVELGLATSTSSVDLNARAQASLALIMERSADAQGQFGREATTAAGAAAIASAKAANAADDLGSNFLPIYARLAETVGVVAEAFAALPAPVQTATLAIGALGATGTLGPILEFVGKVPAGLDRVGAAATKAARPVDGLGGSVRKLAGTGGALTLAGAAAVGAAVAFEQLAEAAAEGDFGSFAGDIERVDTALQSLAETGQVIGILAEDLPKLAAGLQSTNAAATGIGEDLLAVGAALPGFLGDAARAADAFDNALDIKSAEEFEKQVDTLDKRLTELFRADPDAAKAAFEGVRNELILQGATAEQVAAAFDDYATAVSDADQAAQAAGDGSLARRQEELAAATDDVTAAFLESLTARDAVIDAEDRSLSSARRVEDTQRRIADLSRERADLDRERRSASLDLADAERALLDVQERLAALPREEARAELDIRQANLDLIDAEKRAQETLADPAATAEERARAEIELERAKLRIADAEDQLRDVQQEAAAGGDTLARAQLAVQDAQQRVADTARTAADLSLEQKRAQEDLTIASRDAAAAIEAEAEANRKLLESQKELLQLQAFLQSLDPLSGLFGRERQVEDEARARRAREPGGRRAGGGATAPGSVYEVGEAGPEIYEENGRQYLLTGGQGGNVDPSPRVAGASFNPTINIYGGDPKRTARATVREFRRAAFLAGAA